MKQFRFLDWEVYQDAQGVNSLVLSLVKKLPSEFRFEFGNQVLRSSLSIVLNIAEGSGKHSQKEFNRFIEIAPGSAYETAACLDTLHRNKLISNEDFLFFGQKIKGICKQLGGLQKTIKKTPPSE